MKRFPLFALAACAMLGAPAVAQQLTKAQKEEAHCIVLYVPEGEVTDDVVMAYIDGGGMTDAGVQAIKTGQEACTAKYGWDAETLNTAMTIALSYLSVEWHMAVAEEMEISMSVLNNLQTVVDGLTHDEQNDVFLSKEGSELEQKVRRLLIAQGAPNSDGSIMVLHQLLRDSLIHPTQVERFRRARLP